MTIQRGREWGEEVDYSVIDRDRRWAVGGDVEFVEHVNSASTSPFAIVHGDLFKFLGSPPSAVDSKRVRRLPIDVLEVRMIDRRGTTHRLLTTSLVVRLPRMRGGILRGTMVAIDNCGQFRGSSFSSRSHPNDGKFEMITMTEGSFRDRLVALSRMKQGVFEASAEIRVSQFATASIDVGGRSLVLANDRTYVHISRIEATVLADHGCVHIGVA